MSATREQAVTALVSLVADAYPWVTGPSRRLKLWSDVPLSSRPACFVFEGGKDSYSWQGSQLRRVIELHLFIYLNAKDPNTIGSSLINNVMDALDKVLKPAAGSTINMLGGGIAWCRIDGTPFKDPGDLDGDGMLVVPVKITLP
jgi:hypothetical protein